MRRLSTVLIVLVLVFAVGVGSAAAAPVTATPNLPYVWLRAAPSSYASVVYTVYPTGFATLETTGYTQSDGYQTWAEVYVISNSGIRGWVEQGSLVSAGQAVAPVTNWAASAPAPAWNNAPTTAAWNASAPAPAWNAAPTTATWNPAPTAAGNGQQPPDQNAAAPIGQAQAMPGAFGNAGWQGAPR